MSILKIFNPKRNSQLEFGANAEKLPLIRRHLATKLLLSTLALSSVLGAADAFPQSKKKQKQQAEQPAPQPVMTHADSVLLEQKNKAAAEAQYQEEVFSQIYGSDRKVRHGLSKKKMKRFEYSTVGFVFNISAPPNELSFLSSYFGARLINYERRGAAKKVGNAPNETEVLAQNYVSIVNSIKKAVQTSWCECNYRNPMKGADSLASKLNQILWGSLKINPNTSAGRMSDAMEGMENFAGDSAMRLRPMDPRLLAAIVLDVVKDFAPGYKPEILYFDNVVENRYHAAVKIGKIVYDPSGGFWVHVQDMMNAPKQPDFRSGDIEDLSLRARDVLELKDFKSAADEYIRQKQEVKQETDSVLQWKRDQFRIFQGGKSTPPKPIKKEKSKKKTRLF